jgi:hypothetical protein
MWKLGAEAAQFPEKEYINGIAIAVYLWEDRPDLSWLRAVPGTSPPGQGLPHSTTSQNTDFPDFPTYSVAVQVLYQREIGWSRTWFFLLTRNS